MRPVTVRPLADEELPAAWQLGRTTFGGPAAPPPIALRPVPGWTRLGAFAERGAAVSALYPTVTAVYRSMGWEVAGALSEAELDTAALPRAVPRLRAGRPRATGRSPAPAGPSTCCWATRGPRGGRRDAGGAGR